MQITRQWRDTQRRALQAEADKVNAELSFLKAQINPHFLFNTLNNIYSLAIIKSDQTPNAVMKLSNILRYITDDARQDFVPLQNEVNSVANYIELQKLRLTNKVEIRFTVKGKLEEKQVSPLLFLTFIENAFKYGISSHEFCVITIEITAEEKSIEFFCQNKILVKETDEERVGVGVNNARKRLDYLYPGKHLLRIQSDNGNFSVHLTLMV
jgi:LytS/YehU family sensor histidine kinase